MERTFTMAPKFAVGIIGLIAAFVLNAPDNVKMLQVCAWCLVFIDTITGIAAAMTCRELRSRTMRTKLTLKMIQYGGLVSVAYVATVSTSSWIFVVAIYTAIMSIEVFSIIEKMVKMEKYGGVPMGKFGSKLNLLGQYFDVSHQRDETSVTNVTVIPRNPTEENITSLTSVTKLPGREAQNEAK